MRLARPLWIVFAALTFALGAQWLLVSVPRQPQDLPWTPLDLEAPIGLGTGPKLAGLRNDPQLCRSLLRRAEVEFRALPPRRDGEACGWSDAVRLVSPALPRDVLSCPLAASFEVWMTQVVQPAALSVLGSPVVRVDDLGSYACRRIRGDAAAAWSEHASANAIDVSGFRLADGRRLKVTSVWRNGPRGVFLHQVRDGACRLFATTLSPDYNAAHHDHLHLDEAARGEAAWRACD